MSESKYWACWGCEQRMQFPRAVDLSGFHHHWFTQGSRVPVEFICTATLRPAEEVYVMEPASATDDVLRLHRDPASRFVKSPWSQEVIEVISWDEDRREALVHRSVTDFCAAALSKEDVLLAVPEGHVRPYTGGSKE